MSTTLGSTDSLAFFRSTNAQDDEQERNPGTARPKRRRRARRITVLLALIGTVGVITPLSSASADPSSNDWNRLRMCESSNRYTTNTGNGYYGAYQFDLTTWRSVGGSGLPSNAAPAEQDARALMLYRMRGWQPWTCAAIVGLRNDADAGSGRVSDINVTAAAGATAAVAPAAAPAARSTAPAAASTSAPAFPGVRNYHLGDNNAVVAAFQRQMAARGADLTGTGEFGPKTVAVIKRLQAANGREATGLLGYQTWAIAWTGRY